MRSWEFPSLIAIKAIKDPKSEAASTLLPFSFKMFETKNDLSPQRSCTSPFPKGFVSLVYTKMQIQSFQANTGQAVFPKIVINMTPVAS